jgi:hypothetical protein
VRFFQLCIQSKAFLRLESVGGFFLNFAFIPMPIIGDNYPLLSYGGSLLVGHLTLLGFAVGIIRRKNLHLIA